MAVQHEVEPETSEDTPDNDWYDYELQVEVAESTQQESLPEFD